MVAGLIRSEAAIELVETGPRDGLQNLPHPVDPARKINLINSLSDCGFRRIEAGSFVNPRRVPQMADSDRVFRGIRRASSVRYSALVPNLQGLDAASVCGVDEIAVFVSASEGFSKANVNATVAGSLKRLQPVVAEAGKLGLPVRGYVSCVVACPFDGPTPPISVASIAAKLIRMGCYEISLGDTIGAGEPDTVKAMLRATLDKVTAQRLAGHYHDTGGRAVDNILASIDLGLTVFDTAISGLGGCPFAPGAPGNVATELVHQTLREQGYKTGLSPEALRYARRLARAMKSR
ncbi:MAG: hydroxymethylglutaryl-CoA lyase [Rhodobacteraceae bacterium]|nr:hydroxymethylglutaryl-CoA lyase [Paracoccaceae bacterium]